MYKDTLQHETLPPLPKGRSKVEEVDLLPTGSDERGVLGVGCIPVAILRSCQDMKTVAL